MTAPARLLSVRLQGFKSFADRTHVEFGPGISAIVGPNGSGKSNLADALRWALGEQGRALRTRKSEDVVWAGSEKRPAVGMADVQLTLDNGDGLLPVEYGVVELGRRLYRSGENDYLLNCQRVRLKDLVDLLDAGHLAENAFLFIGQGMVDQALALRPEERRPLFEEVAGVRRHERRRRRAEEQLVESAANLARVDDILAELRPQARRLAQQAEQQANRETAAEELAAAILASAHARWHGAGRRAAASTQALVGARQVLDGALAGLTEHEELVAAGAATMDGHAAAEAAARAALERARADEAALRLREGRHAAELAASQRERAGLEEARTAATGELETARQVLALPLPASPSELDGDVAALDAEIAAATGGMASAGTAGATASDAAVIRRLEAARAHELAAAQRRASEAERAASDERTRAVTATERSARAADERATAFANRDAASIDEGRAREAREAAQTILAGAESEARAATDKLAGARAAAAAATARHEDAQRALDAADGAAFSKAARARGGRQIGDGLIIESNLQRAVDAALAGIGRAHVLPRAEIAALTADRGVAIAAESVTEQPVNVGREGASEGNAASRLLEAARSRGGGRLVDAVRRDDSGAVSRLLSRVVWLPDAAACLEIQPLLPGGWLAVARDGTIVAGDVATWIRPDGRGLHLKGDLDRLATERERAADGARIAAEAAATADAVATAARTALVALREREGAAIADRRRADEIERGAAARADGAAREAAWLEAQATRLAAEAVRLRAAVPPEPGASTSPNASTASESRGDDAAATARLAELRRRRDGLAAELGTVRTARSDAERRRAAAEAAVSLAERQLAYSGKLAGDLAEREARLASEREELIDLLATAAQAVTEASAGLAAITAAATAERERLRATEAAAVGVRDRVRAAQERTRAAEHEELEARLALEALRESVLVDLASLGSAAMSYLDPGRVEAVDDLEPEALEAALANISASWTATAPATEAPSPGRLATLRRRLHDLGAINPFAAEEHAEVRTRLDGLETQRADIQAAIERTRDLINELDKLVSDQFRRTFAALERAFDARFQQLFGGGFAKLALTDPQDLAATGIEITARPPGKKPQALGMLSGGERALTAVALLFAMLEVRPVPFCVLDEVDAALDEANIGRFTDALRDLSKQTQCIVITHNRGTIEVADALYGVTVGDDSVSRVISLRLDEATALAERGTTHRAGLAPVELGAAVE